MKKILVTGASGFVGKPCISAMAAKGYEVHAVSRWRPSESALPNISWHELDLLKPGRAADIVNQVRPDGLLHLAWTTEPGKFWEATENVDWLRASLELLGAFSKSGGTRLVAAGSCAEYERSAGECLENSTRLLPTTLYGTSKNAFANILHLSSERTGLSSAWGRIFFMYGPREHPSRLVAYVVRSLLQSQPALCSEGKQILDFLYIDDVASAFIALLESDVQGPVNIASGRPVAVRDVLQEIGRQLGRSELVRLGARPANPETERLWANTHRLDKEVGWVPQFTLADGVTRTIEWWRNSAGTLAQDQLGSTDR